MAEKTQLEIYRDRVWERCYLTIKRTIVDKLHYSYSRTIKGGIEINEIWNETIMIFNDKFLEKYESDGLYLRYLFICVKSKLTNRYNKEQKYYARHTFDPKRISGIFGIVEDTNLFDNGIIDNIRAIERIPSTIHENINIVEEKVHYNEIVEKALNELSNEFHRNVLSLMLSGYKQNEIAQKLNVTPSTISTAKRKYIQPLFKDLLNIGDEEYEELTASNRLVYSC